MTIEEAFSKALKEARKEIGITQQKAAELPDKE
jgi:DNA-binding XRE family transcriptional regulator